LAKDDVSVVDADVADVGGGEDDVSVVDVDVADVGGRCQCC
jgi:hypothetical protein